jgi:NADH-quinone oxidoreductase subunit A
VRGVEISADPRPSGHCGRTLWNLVLILAAAVLAVRNPDPEKVSAYECGFNAFDDARMKFDVRFYLVSILFIIFDLEVAFLFPWAVAFGEISMAAFWSMMVFLAVLTVGFAYEWKKGAWNGSDDRPTRRAATVEVATQALNRELQDKGFITDLDRKTSSTGRATGRCTG